MSPLVVSFPDASSMVGGATFSFLVPKILFIGNLVRYALCFYELRGVLKGPLCELTQPSTEKAACSPEICSARHLPRGRQLTGTPQ